MRNCDEDDYGYEMKKEMPRKMQINKRNAIFNDKHDLEMRSDAIKKRYP